MRRLFACAWLLVAATALAGACGPRAEDVPKLRSDHCPVGGCKDASTSDGGPIVIPDEPLEPWDETGAGPLTGIFAVEAQISARVAIVVETREIFRLRILQKGTHIEQTTTLCALKLPDVPDVATLIVPPILQQVLWQKHVDAEGDFISDTNVLGADYVPPESLLLVGAKLDDIKNDPLPTQKDPSTAIDEDKDGHPGVTIDAKVVSCDQTEQLYVALRTGATLTGKVVTPDLIQGKADVQLKQSVVGLSNDCIAAAANINIQVLPGSPFKAVRVGDAEDIDRNGNVSCAELAIQALDLFGDFWAN
jgi:hypothetical protein